MHRMNLHLAALAVTTLVVLGMGSCQKASPTIKIGAAAPLTGSQAEIGQDLVNGEKLAVEEINARGGVLGKKLELVIMDDKADPKEAVTIANRFVVDKSIVGVVGHLNSGATMPTTGVYHKAEMPLVMPVPTNPKITQQGFDNLFRIPPTDADQGPQAARFAFNQLKKSRFAIIHDKTAYGQGIADEFKKEVEQLGAAVVFYDGITEGQTDFSAVLTRIKGLHPDVLYFGGMYPEGGLIVRQAREMGVGATFMVADGCFTPEFIKIGAKAAEGTVISFLAPPWEQARTAAAFLSSYQAKYGKVKNYAPFGYDGVHILAKAIQNAGKAERMAIVKEIGTPGFFLDGVVGRIEFKPNGDNKNANLYFYEVKGGEFSLIQ